jgi:hypothetical protein
MNYLHLNSSSTTSNMIASSSQSRISNENEIFGHKESVDYEDYQKFYEIMREITGIYLFPIISTFGILGNIFVIIVYAKSKIYSTSFYLIALSLSDILKLLNDLAYFLVSFITKFNSALGEQIFLLVYSYTHYIFIFTALNTSWLTCAIAIDRFLTVVKALTVHQSKAFISIALIFLASTIFAVPPPLFNQINEQWDPKTNTTIRQLGETPLGKSDFKKYYHFLNGIIRTVIPIILLIYLNYRILRVVYANTKRMKNKATNNNKANASTRITIMLVTIVVTFIICVFPDSCLTMMQMGYANEDYFIRGIREITDLLMALNSASTFPICLYFSTEFRLKFTDLILSKKSNSETNR